jgi:hypothetical protein
MKTNNLNLTGIITLVALGFITLFFSACEQEEIIDQGATFDIRGGGESNIDCYLLDPSAELTEFEETSIIYMREEEKLARDVYITLFNTHQIKIFDNISKSENQHMERVLCLIDYYELEDPASDVIGEFNDPALQSLYNLLIAQGTPTVEAALAVGATIEDLDIYDLENSLAATENPAIVQIFENLACGSKNHIRAFTAQLANLGITYEAQHIPQAYLDEILASDNEKCGNLNNSGECDGTGPKNGGQGNKGNSNGGNGNCDGTGSANGGNGNGGSGNGDCDGTGSGNGGNGNSGSGNGGSGNGGNGNGGNGNGGNGNGGNGNGGN